MRDCTQHAISLWLQTFWFQSNVQTCGNRLHFSYSSNVSLVTQKYILLVRVQHLDASPMAWIDLWKSGSESRSFSFWKVFPICGIHAGFGYIIDTWLKDRLQTKKMKLHPASSRLLALSAVVWRQSDSGPSNSSTCTERLIEQRKASCLLLFNEIIAVFCPVSVYISCLISSCMLAEQVCIHSVHFFYCLSHLSARSQLGSRMIDNWQFY